MTRSVIPPPLHVLQTDYPDAATAAAGNAAPPQFEVTSAAFADNSPIPAEFSRTGRNAPPPLQWQNVPASTQSLALVVHDPEAVGGLYIHWVVTGIPPSTSEIVEGALPQGTQVSANSGVGRPTLAPVPAGTGVHHYRFSYSR